MLYIYSKPLCSACQEAKKHLREYGVPFEEREFSLEKLSKDRHEDVVAMAMYHYQEETLPVFVLDLQGLTFEEVKHGCS